MCNFCFTFSLCERETGVNFGTYVVSVCKYGTWLRKGTVVNQLDETNPYGSTVERLYCKRPIQCLASSKILTPHTLTARRVCTTLPLVRAGGGGHYRRVERGWGVNILEDARHCSVLYIQKYFVGPTVYTLLMRYELQLNFPPSGGKNWFINRWFLSLSTPLNVLIFQQWCLAHFRERKGQNGSENPFASKRTGDPYAYFVWKRNSPHLKRSDEN
jgi:hypothetical protein